MIASTNDSYCSTLRGREGVVSQVPEGANSVIEIVVDGLDRPAGNYGGKLGKHHFYLHELLS